MNQKKYPKEVFDYLDSKAINRWKLEWNEASGIENVIVIPAISEFENIPNLLSSLIKNDRTSLRKTLIIIVINNSVLSENKIKDDNKKSTDLLRSIISKSTCDNFLAQISKSGINIGLIDATSKGNEFTEKEAGVGLARKIGLDEALKVFDYSKSGKKILIFLDADCLVLENYLKEINNFFNENNISIATTDFEHFSENKSKHRKGIILYEIFLRHYVTGLLFAKSPFAFHTIGSTIVCDHEAYIKVGGMNTRKAAEDFYFLQKLAKHYNIHRISSTKIRPSARESWRVPFGTGKSITNYLSSQKEILLYDAGEFVILKKWLELFNSDLALNTDTLLNEAMKIHPQLFNFLENYNFKENWNRILDNTKSEKQLIYQRKNWFDSFKTLKLMHHLRDTSFPMVDIKSGIEKFFKVIGRYSYISYLIEKDDDITYKNYLTELIRLENSLNEKLVNQHN